MFSMIRPFEELMAIEQVPLETDLRAILMRRRNLYALIWLCGWGGAAAVALTALAITSQTKSATERLRSLFAANEPAAVAQMPPRVAQLESETELLIAQVHALRVDRDRMVGRIALLESSIDDMTGAIKRQADATAAALAAKATPPVPTATAPATTRPVPPTAAPGVASPAPASSPLPSVAAALPTAKQEKPPNNQSPAAPSAMASAAETPAIASTAEFGLDLGGAPTVDGIRQRWISVKASFGPLLSGMHPLAAREHRQGGTSYRLIAGPLPNSPAAAALCAHFTAARAPCRPAKFDGEDITVAQH